ncbi:glycosyltransferase [Microbacterium esteraromaticum]|uniref:Glycosyltransferase n=1 Tax=Microbacterium esteraromaticum TaxID=57043 RepID=A0A7D8AK16_9MICO|nr:glycosyltransferase family 2 protein [Microbacterium esteraromaticum]QMU97389.1 glycosyltransferase [Microbacterium esteraromaticum]
MKASVVIPTRGGAARLPALLDSLSEQTHSDWEAIVVIDGDVDDSESVVSRYSHLPVRSVVFPENRGRVAALNAGFATSTGDVLIRADDDFELSPEHISAHVRPHVDGECGVVGLPRNVAPLTPYMRVYGHHADQRGREEAYRSRADARWRLWGGNVSVSRAVYERIGDYDDRYRGYGWEDIDYGFRLHRAGIPVVLADDAEVIHHVAATTTEIRVRRAFDSGSARWTFDTIHGVGTSGPAAPADRSLWNHAVTGLSRVLSRGSSLKLARFVDRALPILPPAFGRRAVGLTVEASGFAGYRRARQAADGPGVEAL